MSERRQIAMLWVNGPLSYLEQVCMVSFLDAGHPLTLYTYDDVTLVPDGVEVRDARTILPDADFVVHERTGSPAPQSDKFRYRLLAAQDGVIWADTDAYCLRPFEPVNGHYYGYLEGQVATGVLALPRDSATLKMLLDATEDPFTIPPWLPPRLRKPIEEKQREQDAPVNIAEMLWGIWGPIAFHWMLHKTGEIEHALPEHVFYPLSFSRRRALARPGADLDRFFKPDTVSIHFYGRRMRSIMRSYGGVPDPDSLVGRLLTKHGIDPAAAPIRQKAPKAAA